MINLIQKYRILRTKEQDHEKQLRSILELIVENGSASLNLGVPSANMFSKVDFGQALIKITRYVLQNSPKDVFDQVVKNHDDIIRSRHYQSVAECFEQLDQARSKLERREQRLQDKEVDMQRSLNDAEMWISVCQSQQEQIRTLTEQLCVASKDELDAGRVPHIFERHTVSG